MSPAQGSRIRLSAILVVLAGLNLGGGFLMHAYILARLGAGVETDALFAGMALPQVMLAIVGSSFMHVVVPLLAGSGDHEFRRDAWGFAATTLAVFAPIAVVLAVLAPRWTPLVAPGLPAPGRHLLVEIARIQLIGMVCTALVGVLWAVQRARHRFIWGSRDGHRHPPRLWLPGHHAAAVGRPRRCVGAVLHVGVHVALLAPGPRPLPDLRGQPGDGGRGVASAAAADARHGVRPHRADRQSRAVVARRRWRPVALLPVPAGGAAALQVTHNALIAPTVPALAAEAKDAHWTAFRARLRHSARSHRRGHRHRLRAARPGRPGVRRNGPGIGVGNRPRAWWPIVGLGGVLVATPLAETCRAAFYAMGQTARPVRIDAAVFTLGLVLKVAGFLAFGVWGMAVAASMHAVLSVLALRAGLRHAIPAGDGVSGRPS